MKPPWKFYNCRDTRTIYDYGKINLNNDVPCMTKHHALHDCWNQIYGVKLATIKLNIT